MRTLLLILIYCFITIAQPLSIELSVDSAFYINNTYTYTDEDGKSVTDTIPPSLFGSFKVKVSNTSGNEHTFLLWPESHNIQFSSGDSSVVLVHQCTAAGMKSGGKSVGVKMVTLSPKADTLLIYDTWECSSPFRRTNILSTFTGDITAQFRLLPASLARTRASKITYAGLRIHDIITRWEELLNSDEYWEGAYLSNKVKVTIPVK